MVKLPIWLLIATGLNTLLKNISPTLNAPKVSYVSSKITDLSVLFVGNILIEMFNELSQQTMDQAKQMDQTT